MTIVKPSKSAPQNATDHVDLEATGQRILVVDDEAALREIMTDSLTYRGYQVRTASTGTEALQVCEEFKPHAIILDVMLPDFSGFEVCKKLRAAGNNVGILFLTAKDTVDDEIKGLSVGGDDYVRKGASLMLIGMHLRALLRRTLGEIPEADPDLISFADLELNEATHEVHRAGKLIDLSPTEFLLLRFLMDNANRVVSKAQILDHVWKYDFRGDMGIVETYVSYLRKKIDVFDPPLIHTVRGVGYRLRMPSVT